MTHYLAPIITSLIILFYHFFKGHNEQKDEWIPRLIKYFNPRVTGGAIRAYCGSMFSVVISGHNNPYLFGKNKPGGDGCLYPKAIDAICGMCEIFECAHRKKFYEFKTLKDLNLSLDPLASNFRKKK